MVIIPKKTGVNKHPNIRKFFKFKYTRERKSGA